MLTLVSGNRDAFFEAPFHAYPADGPYVSPMRSDILRMLDPTDNPLLNAGNPYAFWTAHRDGRPIGRIIALVHQQSNARHGTRRAQFGFFDCADDPEAAALLLDAAKDFARRHDLTELAGNFNLTAMQQAGVVTEGFDARAYTDMVVNPAHIPTLLERNGFEAFFPMSTFTLDLATATPPQPDWDVLAAAGYRFAPIARSDFKARMEEARIVLNDGFSDNPMFVPLTADEFDFQAREMMTILDPRLSAMLHHDGRPVGTIICIPDLNGFMKASRSRYGLSAPWHFLRYRLNRRRAVIIFYSVARDHHGLGLNSAMLARVINALKTSGYDELGITWIADQNAASLRQMEKIGAQRLQRLHLFRKAIA
ncbi:acetyltransferase GNAT family protein [Asticcacaulis biprosthecium C19]|uniref:Acetyltransferase GNAT family protein n=1 Tax=Asticcacaulis biprosthecium C19 TaxID=715226 RepID=F4QNS4_9CAUL|nr:GNAT family N-acetyltransferase [Asticcacaulis biprosthecium]EGF90982.1 acetyltransferase GNAT family protein [Asticcacaulis biprosthecium C19]